MSASKSEKRGSLKCLLNDLESHPEHFQPIDSISFHLKVPENKISAKTLADIESGLQSLADTLFKEFLPDRERPVILLGVPREGCFEAAFYFAGTVAICVAAKVANGVIFPFVDGFCKDMLGRSLSEFAQITGQACSKSLKNHLLVDYISTALSLYLDRCVRESATILAGFDRERVKLQKGKNKTFRAIEEDSDVSGVSFDGVDYIKRSDFSKYIDESVEDQDNSNEVEFKEGTIQVTSPVSMQGKTNRGWAGIFYEKSRYRGSFLVVFSVQDGNFKRYVNNNKIKPAVDDVMKVQMLKVPHEKIKWHVLRVTEFKGKRVSPPLSKDELTGLNVTREDVSEYSSSLLEYFNQ